MTEDGEPAHRLTDLGADLALVTTTRNLRITQRNIHLQNNLHDLREITIWLQPTTYPAPHLLLLILTTAV